MANVDWANPAEAERAIKATQVYLERALAQQQIARESQGRLYSRSTASRAAFSGIGIEEYVPQPIGEAAGLQGDNNQGSSGHPQQYNVSGGYNAGGSGLGPDCFGPLIKGENYPPGFKGLR